MIRCTITIPNLTKTTSKLTQKMGTSKGLCDSINLKIALPLFRLLKQTIPVWTGDARMKMYISTAGSGNTTYTVIGFPTADPIRGHPYIWYTEHGRPPITGKTDPKMRFWNTPHKSLSIQLNAQSGKWNDKGLVFRKSVGAHKPSFFIRDAMTAYRRLAPQIASREVARWLRW